MVLIVRCFKCGQQDVRLIVGGRSIIHARCHSCGANLLEEVMEFEAEIEAAATGSLYTTAEHQPASRTPRDTSSLEEKTSTVVTDDEP